MTEIYFSEVFDILPKYKDNSIIYSEDIFNKINKIYSKLVKRKNVSQLNLTNKIYSCYYYGRKCNLGRQKTKYEFYPDFYSITVNSYNGTSKTKYFKYD